MADTNRFRYFLYSQNQHKVRVEAESRINKQYVPGQVLVNGRWKSYTEISTEASNNRFADAIVVASGNLEDMKYTKSTSAWIRDSNTSISLTRRY